MSSVVVEARHAQGLNMSPLGALVGRGPKWSIVCGRCGCGFRARLAMVDNPIVVCPCGTPNRIGVVVS